MVIGNSAFISDRREPGYGSAMLIWEGLRDRGIDAFLDLESLREAGAFDVKILNQIAGRPYFVIVLTEGTLDRCQAVGDWLWLELEHAFANRRIVVPAIIPPFDFDDAERFLPSEAALTLRSSQGISFPPEYFDDALDRLADELRPVDVHELALSAEDREFARRAAARVERPARDPDSQPSLLAAEGGTPGRRDRASERLPTGVVTLVLTDVVGSTRLWQRSAAAMDEALARHSELIEAAVSAHSGRLLRWRGEGDSTFSVFGRASDGVRAALQAQRALNMERWPPGAPLSVRVAIHSGEAVERDGDFFGPAVNRAARLRDVSAGGDIVISGTTADLVADGLPSGVGLVELGTVRLRDVERAERVFGIVADGIETPAKLSDAGPMAPESSDCLGLTGDDGAEVAHNLPWSPTPLIGREVELATLGKTLGDFDRRLLTLVGPPGVGKTRLAAEVARCALPDYPDGVWFVDLGGVADAALVPTTVAAAAQVRADGIASVTATLVARWQGGRVLLVLDNCEHLRDGCAELVHAVLAGCTEVSILATSRQPLQVRGEQEIPITPLAVPAVCSPASPETLAEVPAVALFVARVEEVNPDFGLTAANSAAVAELCQRLDGVPLALELAARWMRLLAPAELLVRLDPALDVLRDGAIDLPARQRTVRDAVRWSYNLIPPAEQAMFRRFAVFRGGATIDAAAAVGAAAGELGDDPVLLLNHLVAASLVQRHQAEGSRMRMLAVVREFASELLASSADNDPTALAHTAHFAAMADSSNDALTGPDQQEWMARLTVERDNLRAALSWLRHHDVDQGLAMAASLWRYWDTRSEREEARSWLRAMLAADDPASHTHARAWALRCLGNVDWTYRDYNDATAHYEESLDIAKQLGDEQLAAGAIAMLGNVASATGDWTRSREYHEEALRIYRSLGADWSAAVTLTNLAKANLLLGDATAAAALCEQARMTISRLGDETMHVWCLVEWAEALHFAGERERAWTLYKQALPRVAAFGDLRITADTLSTGGLMVLDAGDLQHAEIFLATALVTRVEYAASDLTLLAEVAAGTGDQRRAAALLGAASAIMAKTGDALGTLVQDRFERAARNLRATLGESDFDAAWRDGQSSPDSIIGKAAASAADDLQALIDYVAADRPPGVGGSRAERSTVPLKSDS